MRTGLRGARFSGNNLLTGKFTGNFAVSGYTAVQFRSEFRWLPAKLPAKQNRGFFSWNREILDRTGEPAKALSKRPFLAHLFRI
jgi:hypothetical protein